MFLYQALHKEKETSHLTLCIANFGLMATSLMESERQLGAPPVPVAFTNEFFALLDRMVLFLSSSDLFFFFLFLFYQVLSTAFDFSTSKDFSMSKDFSISEELPRVNFVNYAM